jgi:hypothetical protein
MFLNHEDIPNLPGSLLININESQFRILFTDDKIICFLCKSVKRTTYNCTKNNENNHGNDAPLITIETHTEDTVVEQIEDILPPIIPNVELKDHKRPFSYSSSLETPSFNE